MIKKTLEFAESQRGVLKGLVPELVDREGSLAGEGH
jgi:hypothetical protein